MQPVGYLIYQTKNQPWTLIPPVPPDWFQKKYPIHHQYMLSVIIKTPYGYQFKSQYHQYNTGSTSKKIIKKNKNKFCRKHA
jgi:hypothetical protein